MPHREMVAQNLVIVDDHIEMLEALTEILRRTGNRNRIVTLPGQTSLHQYLDSTLEPPDILLIDMRLQDGSGEGCIQLANQHPSTKDRAVILGITGHLSDDVAARAREAGADGIIQKPITSDAVMEALMAINGFGWQIVRKKK